MKKVLYSTRFLLLFVAAFSLFIYSCMKDEFIPQTKAKSELNGIETTNPPNSVIANTPEITKSKHKLAIHPSEKIVSSKNVSSQLVGEGDCSEPPTDGDCTTVQFTATDNITVNMPATTRNPYPSIAVLTFTQTICWMPNGDVQITYQNVRATPIGGSVYTHWTTLSSPTLDEAIDEYEILAATRMENMMTAIFFAANPTVNIVESRYFRGLCYLTCILEIGSTLSTERTTCGDKCCLRTRLYQRVEDDDISIVLLNMGYSETGGECLGSNQSPCNEHVVKVTENCEHDCVPTFIAELPVDL